ncbi:MAG: hypothetical protein GYA33_13090 [Thermogutta sp.]|nr:hypothetical protein [Thermogutta sp.]
MTDVPTDLTSRSAELPVDATLTRQQVAELLEAAGGDGELLRLAVEEGLSASAVRRLAESRALEAHRASRPVIGACRAAPQAGPQELVAAAAIMLAGREDLLKDTPGVAEQARALRVRSLHDLAAAACQLELGYVPTGRGEILRAAGSTRSLPFGLGSAMEKIVLSVYEASRPTWRSFCKALPASDFREHVGLSLDGAFTFAPLAPGGSLEHGVIGERALTYKISTFGKIVELSREDLINDDAGLLATIPEQLGRSAIRSQSDTVFRLILSNPGSFFSTANNNLLTGAESALSVTSLAAALATLRQMSDADGPLDIVPRFLLVPPELESTGRQILNSTLLARDGLSDQQPQGNPFAGVNLELLVEPRLSSDAFPGSSKTSWYLIAGPNDVPWIASALNGQFSPTIEQTDLPADQLGLGWRAYCDFGTAVGDPRSFIRATGV